MMKNFSGMSVSKICILFIAFTTSGFGANHGGIDKGATEPLIPELILKTGRLELVWQNTLPMKKLESLEQIFPHSRNVYYLSDRNYLLCLSKKTGELVFGKDFNGLAAALGGISFYEDTILLTAGDRLLEIDASTGETLADNAIPCRYSCAVARNKNFYYVGGGDARLHVLRASDRTAMFNVSAGDGGMIMSVIADGNAVIFGTSGGTVIKMLPDKAIRYWNFEFSGGVVGKLVESEGLLLFASDEGYVYALDTNNGKLKWRYKTGDLLGETPVVSDYFVYQQCGRDGLCCIFKENGQLNWNLEGGLSVICESEGRAYIFGEDSKVTVMHNQKAQKLYDITLAGVEIYAPNTSGQEFFVGSRQGKVVCLRPEK